MSRLASDSLGPLPSREVAVPSRRTLLSIIVALAVLVLGLTLASPGRADRQLIERGTDLMTRAAGVESPPARAVTVDPDAPSRGPVQPARPAV
jgi:hypothetical protein